MATLLIHIDKQNSYTKVLLIFHLGIKEGIMEMQSNFQLVLDARNSLLHQKAVYVELDS